MTQLRKYSTSFYTICHYDLLVDFKEDRMSTFKLIKYFLNCAPEFFGLQIYVNVGLWQVLPQDSSMATTSQSLWYIQVK